MRIAAAIISTATIGLSLTACDLSNSIPLGFQTLQQIEHDLHLMASRMLHQVRLHSQSNDQIFISAMPRLARAVDAFNQSIGVNVHMSFMSTPYRDVAAVRSTLKYLGINYVRDAFYNAAGLSASEELAAAGIKFDLFLPVFPDSTVDIAEFMSQLDTLEKSYPGSIVAVEGPNEVNSQPAKFNGGTSPTNQVALQAALHAAVGADPNLKGIPVYSLTIGSDIGSAFEAYGDLSPFADYGNAHPYLPDDSTPGSALDSLLPIQAGINARSLPIVITETGWTTDSNDPYNGADQMTQAKLTLDTLMDAFKDGVVKTYVYELMDEASDTGNTNNQYHYGLFNFDGTPKLAANAIHNLTTILADPGSILPFTPGTLSYAIPDLPPNCNQLLLEKNDRTFELVLWAETPVWDPATKNGVVAPTKSRAIKFEQMQKAVRIFDPLQSTTPIATYSYVQLIQVELTDHPIIIEIENDTSSSARQQPRPTFQQRG
jgi:trimeric autotransporter adhesin